MIAMKKSSLGTAKEHLDKYILKTNIKINDLGEHTKIS